MTKERDEIDEINKLRFKAFASNSADDLAAFREAAAKWFMNEATRALDRSYAQEAEADTLRAEVARLRAAIEPFADVSDFLARETEGLSNDDVFNLKLAGSKFLLMTYTAKQFHDARAALAHREADQ
jgi:hypothetical protein